MAEASVEALVGPGSRSPWATAAWYIMDIVAMVKSIIVHVAYLAEKQMKCYDRWCNKVLLSSRKFQSSVT